MGDIKDNSGPTRGLRHLGRMFLMSNSTTSVTGNLSITLGDGTELRDTTDVGLARQWVRHEVGADQFNAMSLGEQSQHIAEALAALRDAAAA